MSSVVRDTWWMTARRLAVFVRQPWFLVITLIQPVIWLFLFGSLFRKVVELPGFGAPSYLDYLVPGVIIMNAVSANMWAGMTMLEEIDRGTLNRFLITPVSRSAIINASVVEQAFGTTVQSVIIVLLGLAAGACYPGGPLGLVVLVLAAVLLGTLFGAASNAVGMLARQRETIIGMYTFLLLPLTFLSSAFMARGLMPHWMQVVAGFNPVSWALSASRAALVRHADWAAVARYGAPLLALAALLVWLSTRTFRAYQESV
jgi:ABC-2 type transport system permease protein